MYFVLQEERKQASFEQLLRVANSEREVKLKAIHYHCEMKILKKMLLLRQVVAYVYSVHHSSPE